MSVMRSTGSSRPRRVVVTLATAATIALLAGCENGSMTDLEAWVVEIKGRPGARIEELPPIQPYESKAYTVAAAVDPFEPFYREDRQDEQLASDGNGLRPDEDRNREELERYALDSLRMMGTLERDEEVWGVVRSPDQIIHRVQVGNYLGQNHGKIIGIFEDGIELAEIVPDGQGGWIERAASLALIE